MTQVTIIGLGLIGSSIGMAIRSARKNVKVVGFDHNSGVQSRAKKIGAIDDTEWRLNKAIEDADLVVGASLWLAVAFTLVTGVQYLIDGSLAASTTGA